MSPVGTQGEGGVSQAAQIAHHLGIGWAAKLGLVEDGFFELRVCDLALGHGSCDAYRAKQNDREENSCRFHFSLRPTENVREPFGDDGKESRVRIIP